MTMDFQSAMETFAEAWVAANAKGAPLADVATQVHSARVQPLISELAGSHADRRGGCVAN